MSSSSIPIQREPVSCPELLKALADRTRLEVVRLLLDGPAYVFELAEELEIEQSLLSHHLRVLREVGIVEAHRDGKAVAYALSPAVGGRGRGRNKIDLGCCALTMR